MNPYAEVSGTFYIRADHSGIPPLILLVDGTTQTFFKGNRHSYIKLDEAIAWHEREKSTGTKHAIKETMIRARDRFIASPGEGTRVDP